MKHDANPDVVHRGVIRVQKYSRYTFRLLTCRFTVAYQAVLGSSVLHSFAANLNILSEVPISKP